MQRKAEMISDQQRITEDLRFAVAHPNLPIGKLRKSSFRYMPFSCQKMK